MGLEQRQFPQDLTEQEVQEIGRLAKLPNASERVNDYGKAIGISDPIIDPLIVDLPGPQPDAADTE